MRELGPFPDEISYNSAMKASASGSLGDQSWSRISY